MVTVACTGVDATGAVQGSMLTRYILPGRRARWVPGTMVGMCGRFAVTTDPALLAEKIDAINEATATADASAAAPNYNVAPTATIPTVVSRHRGDRQRGEAGRSGSSLIEPRGDRQRGEAGRSGSSLIEPSEPDDEPTRRVRLMRWGLIPPWIKVSPDGGPDTKGPLLINARADKIATSPAFRSSAKSKRCLVPMDGWYEWQANADPVLGKKAPKAPFFMHRDDGATLFMAGLWSVWKPASSAAPLLSCTIITTDAVGELAEIHDRMPLILAEDDWDAWLNPDAPLDPELLARSPDVHGIDMRPVSTLVNSVRNNGPELLEPATPQPEQITLL